MTSRPADPAQNEVIGRPSGSHTVLMAVAVIGVSASAPIIAATAAPALAIAFWRNAMAAGVLIPATAIRGRGELRAAGVRGAVLSAAAGLLLAAHFAAWIPSLTMTSVAASTALVTTQPLWAALLARLAGFTVPARAWWGMLLALAGVLMVTGVDFTISGRALAGDLLALAGGVFGAGYVTLGGLARRPLSTTTYTALCYGVAAAALFLACLLSGQQLTGYQADAWLKLAALVLFAQFLGHSVFNLLLRSNSATLVSLVALLEVPGAALIAAVWLGQLPPLAALPGLVVMLAGIALVIKR